MNEWMQENGIATLKRNIDALATDDGFNDEDDAELNELIVENTKLKHRLAILNKVNIVYILVYSSFHTKPSV